MIRIAHLRLLGSRRPGILPTVLSSVLGAVLAAGCGGRSDYWSSPIDSSPPAFALPGAVALVDVQATRIVLLTPGPNQSLTTTPIPVGPNILNAVASPDGRKLFVVSGGHRAQIGNAQPDESPSLTVIDPSQPVPAQKYLLTTLTDPLAGLAVDPGGHWVVLYAGSGTSQPFVANPNELVILDVTKPPATAVAVSHNLMSFGGRPQRFTFTQPLALPTGLHPLLVVESDQGLSLLQLEHPEIPEITVPLTNGSDTRLLTPAGIAVDPGDASHGAGIGIRLTNDSDVVSLQFVAEPGADLTVQNGFVPTVNLTDVGGIPSDLAFVHTDGGLRLAALVPPRSKATLIDPVTSLTEDVALPVPYQSLSLVTDPKHDASASNPNATVDVALLWNGSASRDQEGVAFWELGQTSGQPYRSIATVGITDVIAGVLDVPAAATGDTLKVLETADAATFYILDLTTRTAAPLLTSTSSIDLSMSPIGDQVWTFVPQGTQVAATRLQTKQPRSLLIERPVSQVFELRRADGGLSAIVLHDQGGIGATLYDADTLDPKTRRLYAGLLTAELSTGGAP
jgi:hypothetical protein